MAIICSLLCYDCVFEVSVSINMAAIRNGLSILRNFLTQPMKSPNFEVQQCNFVGCRMRRDHKRRMLAKKYAAERVRLVALKQNKCLPIEIKQLAQQQIDETIPRQTALQQLTPRCVITSRPRGVVYRWRLSRIVFRHMADYNKLSGVIRAIW